MEEQIGREPKSGEAVEPNTELGEHFKFVGELARAAAAGDLSATLMLDILNNRQLAEIKNLELELQVVKIREIAKAGLSFMLLPETPIQNG